MTATSPAATNAVFRHSRMRLAAFLLALFGGPAIHPTYAQRPGHSSAPAVLIGSDADDRLRLRSITDTTVAAYPLIRSTSRFASAYDTAAGWQAGLSVPELRTIRNSALPFSLNDGALWAGRGWNESATIAATVKLPHLRLILAPAIVSSDNEIFQVIPFSRDGPSPRNVWANPFHPLPESIDLPLRFGDRRLQRLDPGQSSVSIDAGTLSMGIATQNLWWGPGIENAIVLSNSAPGFPHLFVETRQPLSTRFGAFDAQWIIAQLSESAFFDTATANDKRSLAGIAGTWRTPFDPNLTIGLARVVMAAQTGGAFKFGRAFDVFRSAGHLDADTLAPLPGAPRDQITSLFARWAFPSNGFEGYAEWARFEEPLSVRDFLEYPGHSEGYTLGFQWARPVRTRTLRFQGEATYAEPDPSLRLRRVAVTYTSRGVPQGFTNRGQMLGAAIGPGASSQFLGGDLFSPRWRFGTYVERIRWDNGTMPEPIVPQFKRQDVTLLAGLRGGVSWRGVDLLVDFAHAARFNYLFQSFVLGHAEDTAGIDLLNNTLSVTLSTARLP